MTTTTTTTTTNAGKITCCICGEMFHRLDVHLSSRHKKTVLEYNAEFPGAPTISEEAKMAASKAAKTANRFTMPKTGMVNVTAQPAPAPAPTTAATAPKKLKIGSAVLTIRENVDAVLAPFIPVHDNEWVVGKTEREQWEYMALAITSNENTMLVGPTGCGKTTAVLELAAALNQPVRRINLHGDVRATDFVGEKVVDVDDATNQSVVRWIDGVLPHAMRNGMWLVVDEIDAAPAQILFIMQAVLEKGGRLVLSSNGGEVVEAHPDFRVFATANTLGKGDNSGMYSGTNVLNEAFLDRFGVVIEATYPDRNDEIKIIKTKGGIAEDVAAKMVDVARKVREANTMEQCFSTFSTRRLIAWATKTAMLGDARRAATVTVLNKLEGDDKKFIAELLQRFFGGKL